MTNEDWQQRPYNNNQSLINNHVPAQVSTQNKHKFNEICNCKLSFIEYWILNNGRLNIGQLNIWGLKIVPHTHLNMNSYCAYNAYKEGQLCITKQMHRWYECKQIKRIQYHVPQKLKFSLNFCEPPALDMISFHILFPLPQFIPWSLTKRRHRINQPEPCYLNATHYANMLYQPYLTQLLQQKHTGVWVCEGIGLWE